MTTLFFFSLYKMNYNGSPADLFISVLSTLCYVASKILVWFSLEELYSTTTRPLLLKF